METNVFVMDNDSGYVSHNQESNLDSSSENLSSLVKSPTKPFCLSEETLLENPLLRQKDESFDSVINASQSSTKTNFSGLEDSDLSDTSLIIPYIKPITVNLNEQFCDMDKTGTGEHGKDLPQRKSPAKTVLGNITNSCDINNLKQAVPKKCSSAGKENISVTETPQKPYENRMCSDISPDLFADEDVTYAPVRSVSPPKKTPSEKYINKKDIKLLKIVQSGMGGVCPPPSVTIIQFTVNDMLEKIRNNSGLFWTAEEAQPQGKEGAKSLLMTEMSSSCIHNQWPEILEVRYHGLHHNRSKLSEEFEQLCGKYAERYVGAETQSSCTVFESNLSPLKKKSIKPRWAAKSPGRRLSHLARRRITFSSANLQAASSSSILGNRTHQILVDAKKLSLLNKRKSPRKTPSKSPFKTRKNTPSSSAKKKLAMRFREMSGEFEDIAPSTSSDYPTFKKALFQSPKRDRSLIGIPGFSAEKKSTKRALFQSPSKGSPHKKSPFKVGLFDRKRKRSDSDENNPAKLSRSMSLDIRPTQSGARASMSRTASEANISRPRSEELSEVHKKKLQWAVYESLRLKNITSTHPQYKVFASVLARVTRRFLPSLSRLEGGTTDRMFRIARHYSHAVVKGKSVDEIVNEYMKTKAKNQKPHGYVGLEEFNNSKNRETSFSRENVLQDRSNTIGSTEKHITKPKNLSESKLDRIKKVISFEESTK